MDTTNRPDLPHLILLLAMAVGAFWWGFRPVSSPSLDASSCVATHWNQWEDARGTVPPPEVEAQWWEDCMATRRTR